MHDALREDVIVIFASPKLFSRERAQVAFCVPGAFGLQLTRDAEGAAVLFFPPTFSQKLTMRGFFPLWHPAG